MARAAVHTLSTDLVNHIINGNFDFWQRGTTNGTNSGKRYLADRFFVQSTGSTYSNDRITFTPGQTDVPGEPTYNNQVAVVSSAGASNLAFFSHSIENVRKLAGKTITLSFYAKASVARNIAVEFLQDFGSGGSPSSTVTAIGVTTLALTTAWAKYTVTVTMPSITGKTIGTTENTSNTNIIFWLDAGSTFNARTNSLGQQGSANYNFSQIMLVEGSISPERYLYTGNSLAEEFAACLRYYQKSYDPQTAPGTATGSQGSAAGQVFNVAARGDSTYNAHYPFKATLRSQPTLVVYDLAGNSNRVLANGSNNITPSATSASNSSHTVTFNASDNGYYGWHWTADADF